MLAAATVLATGASLLGPVSAQALSARTPVSPHKVWSPPATALPVTKSVSGSSVPVQSGRVQAQTAESSTPTTESPAPGTYTVTVPAATAVVAGRSEAAASASAPHAVRAGKLPIWLAAAPPAASQPASQRAAASVPVASGGTVQAAVLDQSRAQAAGIHGLLMTLARTDAADRPLGLQVAVDLSSLDSMYGADASSHARLVELPACSLTTPQVEGCLKATPLAVHVDPASGRTVADLSLPARPVRATAGSGATASSNAELVLGTQTSSTSGAGTGTYAATSLQPSSQWTAGGSGGGFSYSYPIETPPALGGSAPQVALSYDSTSVDGRTSSTNSQASIVGDGWDLEAGGYIERSYKSCNDDGIANSGDECWGGYNAVMSLDGHSGQLVHDDNDKTGTWHLQGDDGTTVQFVSPTSAPTTNGSAYNEYVKVTDTSGTIYYFGLDHLPGGDGTDPSTNSLWTVPVYSPKSTDPCYNSAAASASWCQMGWRFNLAYVVDPYGNLITYSYTPSTNYYARGGGQHSGTGTQTSYTAGGALTHIAYGQTLAGQIAAKGTATAAASVVFNLATYGRCDSDGFTCAALVSGNATHWPDVPYYESCGTGACTNYGPSFWTNQELSSIATYVQADGKAKEVDSYALTQSFPPTGDGTSPSLWLAQIQRTGEDGAALPPLPPVTFGPMMLANRVDGTNLVPAPPAFDRARIQTITTETGEQIVVDYNQPACSRTNKIMPASPDTNTMACFPVLWYPSGSTAGAPPAQDWFNAYTVKDITENDLVGGALQRITSYTYGNAAWHRDDSALTDTDQRTWDQFRGFASVTTVTGSGQDGPQTKSVTYYFQGMDGDTNAQGATTSATVGTGTLGGAVTDSDWLSGQVLETDTYTQAGSGGSVADYTYNRPTAPFTTATHVVGGGLPNLVARYTSTTSTTVSKALLANGTWRTSTTTATTDPAHDNRVLTSDATADGLPETCVRTSYATSSNPLITDLVDETATVSGAGACTAAATAGNTVSDQRVLYDSDPFGQAGATGSPTSTQVLDHYDSSGVAQYTTKSVTGYDSYGRVVSTTDPNATDSSHTAGATTTTTYTPQVAGELPEKVTTSFSAPGTAANRTTSKTYDVARSLVLTSVDENNETTTATYDALGRITQEWKAGHATSQSADVLYSYVVGGAKGPSSTTTQTFGPLGAKRLSSIQILNGFGQLAQTQSTPGSSAYTGRIITDTVYDSHGWAVETHNSWYNSSAPSTSLYSSADTEVPSETATAYDGQGRPVTVTQKSYGQSQNSTATYYPGADETDVDPPAGATPTTTITDAAGRTVQLWQYRTPTATRNASDADVTTSSYTPGGQVATRSHVDRQTTDTWTYAYDLQGRQTSATDPDTGTTTTTYTPDGQVATTTDARGQTLAYTYDLLGRETGEYSGSVAAVNQLAGWTYDTVAGGLGEPATATRYIAGAYGPSITQSVYGYDSAYDSTGTTTTMPGAVIGQTTALSYTSRAAYDTYSGVLTASQDGAVAGQAAETINYTYDSNGPLLTDGTSSTDYDLSSDYDAFGRAVRTTLNPWGSEIVATYNYDQASGRVLSDFIDKQNSTSGSVDQYAYTYNQAGQLTSTSDIADDTPSNTDLQCYSYDYLGRLTTAWSDTGATTTAPSPSIPGIGGCNDASPTSNAPTGKTTVGGPAPYWTSYTYDQSGNRTGEVQHNTAGTTADDLSTSQLFGAAGQDNTPTTAPNTGGGTGGPNALLSTTSTGPGNPGPTAYQYDADGDTTAVTTTAGTTNLTWDAEGNLAADGSAGANTTEPLVSGIAAGTGGTLCADDTGGSTTAGNKIQIAACDGSSAQQWTVGADGSVKVLGVCLDATNSGTANGTLIDIAACSGSGAQQWKPGPGGSLINPESGRCLDDPNSTTTPGTQLDLATCSSSGSQHWFTTTSTTYLYDASGNLVVQTDPTLTTVFLGDDEITYNPTSGAPAQDTRYYSQPNGLTVIRQGAAENFQVSDPHGTADLDINSTTLSETRRYLDPFGNPRAAAPAAWTEANGYGDHGFVGGTQDATTGLTNLGAREYQPATGRFLSTDPLMETADPQQWNGYSYAGNAPTDGSDPSGMATLQGGCGAANVACQKNTGAGGEGTTAGNAGSNGVNAGVDPCIADNSQPGCPGYDSVVHLGVLTLNVDYPNAEEIQKQYDAWLAIASKDPDGFLGRAASPSDELTALADMCGNELNQGDLCGRTLTLQLLGDKNKMDLGQYGAWDLNVLEGEGEDSQLGAATDKMAAMDDSASDYGAELDMQAEAGCFDSFPALTRVLMSDGKVAAIAIIVVGDTVESTSPLTGTTQAERVTAVIKTLTDTDFTDLTIHTPTGNRTITSTQHHPYWDTTTQRWTNAADLNPGDHLRQPNGVTVTITHVRDYVAHIITYNLTVAQLHTYYVLAGNTPVLVHNTSGCGPRFEVGSDGTATDLTNPGGRVGVPKLDGGTLQQVGGKIWGNGDPTGLIGTRTPAELRDLSSLGDAEKLQDFYRSAELAGRGGTTAPARVTLTQEIIDAWTGG